MTDQSQKAADHGDRSEHIMAAVQEARGKGQALYITAGGSKRHMLGRACDAVELDVSAHRGIVDYQPAELVLTARAGTPLEEITTTLRAQGQSLSFDPPRFRGRATLGGTLASNLSGPSRPWLGGIRDMVLGVQLITGRAERLDFGGKVMKNVAGYDVSRLQAGALGTLGVLSEISLKVLPVPEQQLTLCYEMSAQNAIDCMNRRAGEPKPLTGACWLGGRLYLRLAGAASAVAHTARQWGGEAPASDDTPWAGLREMELPFFSAGGPLWRFSIGATAPVDEALGPTLIDWCGAQRWIRGEHPASSLQDSARRAGGHVTLFRGGDRRSDVRSPLSRVEQALQRRLKQSFDPDGILNPGRLYSWL